MPSVRALFGKPVRSDSYGPNNSGKIYRVTVGATTYEVSRKQWCLPFASWGWEYAPLVGERTDHTRIKYADTLEDLAYDLGLLE